jgi:tRNA(Arg) A34 adenosine deaminase TadA
VATHILRRLVPVTITDDDLKRLARCVELARLAIEEGNEPFGSILVGQDGATLLEERNGVGSGDHTRHPEFAIARWAAENLTPSERAAATVYTSNEHCPMCAAAHGFNGLGRIVYAVASEQLTQWRAEWGSPSSPVTLLPLSALLPDLAVDGPAPQFSETMKPLYEAKFRP